MPLWLPLLIQLLVAEIEHNSAGHHQGVQDVEEPYIGGRGDSVHGLDGLAGKAENVADPDKKIEQDVFVYG